MNVIHIERTFALLYNISTNLCYMTEKRESKMSEIILYTEAVKEIKNAILQSRYRAAYLANAEQLTLNYNIGRYVSQNTRSGKWGLGAIEAISKQLQQELPGLRGYSATNIKYMRIFYEAWSEIIEPNRHLPSDDLTEQDAILPIRHLTMDEFAKDDLAAFLRVGFTHHREILINCETREERWYYIRHCAAEFWSVESLKYHLKSKDYEKYGAIPNNFTLTIPDSDQASRAVRSFKNEYLLDFVNIEEETDLDLIDEPQIHAEINEHIRKFIMAFGEGFCFIKSGFRIIVEAKEYYIDLLFFSRTLRCLVAIELKRGEFKPIYGGQLSFYLSALDEYVKLPEENPSIGIVLCKEANKTTVEFAIRDYNKPMGVATYKFSQDIPDQYKSLTPVVDGIQQIIEESESMQKEDVD